MKRILFLSFLVLSSVAWGQVTGNVLSSGPRVDSSNRLQMVGSGDSTANPFPVSQSVFVSSVNQSTAQLATGVTFTGTYESTLNSVLIQVNVFGDQGPFTVNVDQCAIQACAAPNHTDSYSCTGLASDQLCNLSLTATSSFWRVRVTNTGGGTTTTFRVDSFLCPIGVAGVSNITNALDPCQNPYVTKQSIFKNITTATTTAVIAASGTQTIYVCGYQFQMTSTVAADTVLLEDGTGAACVTTQVVKTPTYNSGITTINIPVGFSGLSVFQTAAGGEICALSTVGTGPVIALFITYVQK